MGGVLVTTRIYTEIVKYLPVLNSGRSLQKHLVQTWMRGEGKRGKEKGRQGEEWRREKSGEGRRVEKEEEEEEGRRGGGEEGRKKNGRRMKGRRMKEGEGWKGKERGEGGMSDHHYLSSHKIELKWMNM